MSTRLAMRSAATGLRTTARCDARLEANATIAAGTDSRVVMKNGNSLDAQIENARSSPRPTTESFPTGSRTIARSDTDGLRNNFEDIAAGNVRVA